MRPAIRPLLPAAAQITPAAGGPYPRVGEVLFEIGLMLAIHLAVAAIIILALGAGT